jgi:hypothetical protein
VIGRSFISSRQANREPSLKPGWKRYKNKNNLTLYYFNKKNIFRDTALLSQRRISYANAVDEDPVIEKIAVKVSMLKQQLAEIVSRLGKAG